jgi:hypothetical protein
VVLLDSETLQWVALVAAGVAVLALGLCLSLILRIHRIRQAYDSLVAGESGASFVEAVGRQAAGIEGLRGDVRVLRDDLAAARSVRSAASANVPAGPR